MNLRNQVFHAHCLDLIRKMPDNCVDVTVTSSPYWGLRSYGTEPQTWHHSGQSYVCKHEWDKEKKVAGAAISIACDESGLPTHLSKINDPGIDIEVKK